MDNQFYTSDEKQSDKNRDEEPAKKPTKCSVKEFSGAISGYDTSINRELFKNHFSYQRPTTMLKSIDQKRKEK